MITFLITLTIISALFSICFLIFYLKDKFEKYKEYKNLEEKLENLKQNYDTLLNEVNVEQYKKENFKIELTFLENKKKDLIEELSNYQETINNTIENQKNISNNASENYFKILNSLYKEKEEEFNILNSNLEKAYELRQEEILNEINSVQENLNKIKATRDAVLQAALREKEIENSISFYCLDISDIDKNDIAKLEALKPSLNKPRVLSMLIWSTWFQKPLKALSAQVVGPSVKMGIYKITNIKTKECYIGQAVDIAARWSEHAKCGLGIDAPAGNKLYKAMQEYGLWNFSFEVLEECAREDLNEKEKYYIDLYSSSNFGYNSTRGNK